MKLFKLFIISLTLLIITLGCLKEELDTAKPVIDNPITNNCKEDFSGFDIKLLDITSRNGNIPDIFLHLGTLSTENLWLSESGSPKVAREHIVYNKSKIRNVIFNPGVNPNINYNGNTMKHYSIRINFNNSSSKAITAYVFDDRDSFIYIPSGITLLSSNHPANSVTWLQDLNTSTISHKNPFRNSNVTIYRWAILYNDTTFVDGLFLHPTHRLTNQFNINHQD